MSFQKWVIIEKKWTKTCHWQRYGSIFSQYSSSQFTGQDPI